MRYYLRTTKSPKEMREELQNSGPYDEIFFYVRNNISEIELSAVVNLVYLAARDKHRVERDDKAGIGYVDFIFYPECSNGDAIILELKVGSTPDDAIRQIKDRE